MCASFPSGLAWVEHLLSVTKHGLMSDTSSCHRSNHPPRLSESRYILKMGHGFVLRKLDMLQSGVQSVTAR